MSPLHACLFQYKVLLVLCRDWQELQISFPYISFLLLWVTYTNY